jgi:hypothetical protein
MSMAGSRKLSPIEIFELTIADADHLVALVEGFTNRRVRRMRTEMRARIGEVLRVPVRDRMKLDCLESDDVFLVFKPSGRLTRYDFNDSRPLLRQALVAACAAFETYLSDKAMSCVGPLLKSESTLTRRLRELPLTLADWMKIDSGYERKRWGLREHVVEPAVREMSSTSPSQVGTLLSLLGVEQWSKKVDGHRHVRSGETVKELEALTKRRNRIAHEADRLGRGRAILSIDEVRRSIEVLRAVVSAIETLV